MSINAPQVILELSYIINWTPANDNQYTKGIIGGGVSFFVYFKVVYSKCRRKNVFLLLQIIRLLIAIK